MVPSSARSLRPSHDREDVIGFRVPFIVGVARSGTTLLRLMLDAHPAMLEYHDSAANRLDELADRRDGEGRITVDRSDRLGIHQRTSRAPDEARIDQWQELLSGAEIEEVEVVAGELGYR